MLYKQNKPKRSHRLFQPTHLGTSMEMDREPTSHLARLYVRSNYPLKIIHFFNLVNTFYDLFRHIYMTLDSQDSHMKL